MGRNSLPYKTKLTRAMIRQEYLAAVRKQLAKRNLFNPTKPEHGSYSKLVEQLLYDWLQQELSGAEFDSLPERRLQRL